ncbi:5'-deoxyadenosine deaminase [Pendulispora albinea]|uniref:5'-deoxyadenosine deaminase n=1 Tax=Pendulispora albinea TaxID=2741071 RepID=A0ABZ2LTJ2_9BACT
MQTLIRGGTIVTCDASTNAQVLQGDVLVDGGIIVEVGSGPRITQARRGVTRVIDARGCAVIPGFVQAHVHLCQVMFRGMADDMVLLEWLKRRIWPLEAAHDANSLRASAELGLLEMMLAGTTTILDMGTVHHYDAVFDACDRSGVRAIGGKTMMDLGADVPAGLKETTAESLSESDRLAAAWHGKGGGRLRYAYAPRFLLSCSEPLVRGVADRVGASDGVLFHTHAAEHAGERQAVREVLGDDDIAVLRRWGAFGPRTILAHGVQLTDDEARTLASEGTRIVHCPSANLKLGSGIARIADLDALGVPLAMGADGAPCNNNLDPWVELRHAALLAKIRTGVTTLPAPRAFRLATLDGAKALGLGDRIGSIEAGKCADLVVVRLDGAHAEPGGDVFSKLVYACGARDVRWVLVDGEIVVRHGDHVKLDRERVVARARELSRELVGRAELS